MEQKKSSFSSILYVLMAGSLWGFMGLLVRTMNGVGLGAMEICQLRGIITALSLVAVTAVINRKAFRIRLKDLWVFVGTGLISLNLFNLCYFQTIELTSLSVAAVLLYTAPAFVMILSAVLFKEKITARKGVALVLAFAGCALVSGIVGGLQLKPVGILIGLLSGLGYAMYSIFGRVAIQKGYSSLTISLYTFVIAALTSMFFVNPANSVGVLLRDSSLYIKEGMMQGYGSPILTILTSSVVKGTALVLMVSLFPYLLYTKGLEGLENGTASVMASIEPVVATLLGILLYKETINPYQILGMGLVLYSIILINKKSTKKM